MTAAKLSLKIKCVRGRSSNHSLQSVKLELLKSNEAYLIRSL